MKLESIILFCHRDYHLHQLRELSSWPVPLIFLFFCNIFIMFITRHSISATAVRKSISAGSFILVCYFVNVQNSHTVAITA